MADFKHFKKGQLIHFAQDWIWAPNSNFKDIIGIITRETDAIGNVEVYWILRQQKMPCPASYLELKVK